MSTGAESCLTALDTYWDTSIIAKPSMRIHVPDKSNGPTPDTTILDISDGEAIPRPASTNYTSTIRNFAVQIHFYSSNRTNNDKYIKAISKALIADYSSGCGYYWDTSNISPRGIPLDRYDKNGDELQIYDTLLLTNKIEFITTYW